MKTSYRSVTSLAELAPLVGQRIELEGSLSQTMWPHMFQLRMSHPHHAYLDVGDRQTVIYTTSPMPERGRIRVRATVDEVRGSPQEPGQKPSKADENWVEYHLVVDSWEPIED